jgi:hypothetical protein
MLHLLTGSRPDAAHNPPRLGCCLLSLFLNLLIFLWLLKEKRNLLVGGFATRSPKTLPGPSQASDHIRPPDHCIHVLFGAGYCLSTKRYNVRNPDLLQIIHKNRGNVALLRGCGWCSLQFPTVDRQAETLPEIWSYQMRIIH